MKCPHWKRLSGICTTTRHPVDNPNAAWGVWAGVTLAGFLYLEIPALQRPALGHTLTATTRRSLGIDPHRPWMGAATSGYVAALLWLGVHIITGKYGPKRRGAAGV